MIYVFSVVPLLIIRLKNDKYFDNYLLYKDNKKIVKERKKNKFIIILLIFINFIS